MIKQTGVSNVTDCIPMKIYRGSYLDNTFQMSQVGEKVVVVACSSRMSRQRTCLSQLHPPQAKQTHHPVAPWFQVAAAEAAQGQGARGLGVVTPLWALICHLGQAPAKGHLKLVCPWDHHWQCHHIAAWCLTMWVFFLCKCKRLMIFKKNLRREWYWLLKINIFLKILYIYIYCW